MDIDLPEVVAEVRAAFDRYEKALGDNDVDTLDALFWKNPRTIRYGGTENLYGHDEIAAFRAARSPAGLARTISRTVISTYGRDCAVASTLFHRASVPGKVGRQNRTAAPLFVEDGPRQPAWHTKAELARRLEAG
jgi:hypothetical protein